MADRTEMDDSEDERPTTAHTIDTPVEPPASPTGAGAAGQARERTADHDAAVGGAGRGGPVAPDPVDDGSPVPFSAAAPGPGGDPPPDEHRPAVHFIE